MSYTVREQSDYDGHPLELYLFAMGELIWLYTSADHEVTMVEDVYQPSSIERRGFTKGGDARKATMEITIAATNPLALQFRTGWLPSVMVVTVYRHHYQDGDFSVLWKGRVTGCSWSGGEAKLTTESVFTLFQRAGLRRVYQVGCPHQLYGDLCRVDPDAFTFSSTVSEASGAVIGVSGADAFADDYFIGGMLQCGDDLRMIIGKTGSSITLIDGIDGLDAGSNVDLWPGCDRTTTTCSGRFSNIENFGGLPFLPNKNPFSGDALV